MKITIIIDKGHNYKNIRNKITEFIYSHFSENDDIKIYDLDKLKFSACTGCFNCWIKTPGLCNSFNSNELNKDIINSNNFILISELTYGGFSSSSKCIIDKLIPNVSPFFKVLNKNVHHKKRYKKYPSFSTIVYKNEISTKEESNFKNIKNAMSINLHMKNDNSIFINSNTEINDIEKIISIPIKKVEV